jgi:WD40 repeat protein
MNIFKYLFFYFFIALILGLNLNAKDLEPTFSLITSGSVTDVMFKDDKLYASTTASSLDIFDIITKEKIDTVKVPKIKDFTGYIIESKIYSVDVLKDNILLLSQGENGGRSIDIYKNKHFEKIIDDKDGLFIAKAKFLDDEHIIYALLSNQIFIYDMKNKKITNEIQISQSKFSNFSLTQDKSKIIVADESGILTVLDTKTFSILKKFKDLNLDNVFQVDTKNDLIITAGQDRRVAIYSLNDKIKYFKEASFLVYSVGLSPSGKIGAFASDEDNNVTVFNINSKENLYKLTNNKTTLTNILFINENEVFVTSDDKKINYYKLN